jgi:hypothetical protein
MGCPLGSGDSVRYAYVWDGDIGPTSTAGTPEEVMAYFLEHPREIFAFGLGQCDQIEEGNRCDLETGPYYFNGDPAPVEVTDISPTSFEFTSLPGHFDGPGRKIRFTIHDRNGTVYLRHTSNAPIDDPILNVLAP